MQTSCRHYGLVNLAPPAPFFFLFFPFSPRLLPALSPERLRQPQTLQNRTLLPSGGRRRKKFCWEKASVFLFLVLELVGACLSPQRPSQAVAQASLERVWPRSDSQPPAGDIPARRWQQASGERCPPPPPPRLC